MNLIPPQSAPVIQAAGTRLQNIAAQPIRNAEQARLAFLIRRLGMIDPAILATLAAICFGEVRR